MTTTWNIFNTKYQKENGLILNVTYGCTVTLESYIDRNIFEIELEPSEENFIPFEQLTEQIIMGWVTDKVGQETLTQIEEALQTNVTNQKQQKEQETITSGLPWE
jgi:hypothetical protein